jgi:DNA-binding response OmpR family regulator
VDVVVVDVTMPLMDGWSVIQKIKSNPALTHACILVVTGLEPESVVTDATRLGVPILHKPCMPREMLEAVQSVLRDDQFT